MTRLIRCLILLGMLLIPGVILAAGTCEKFSSEAGPSFIGTFKYTLKCTAHTDSSLSVPLSDTVMKAIAGHYIYTIGIYSNEAVAPKVNSDLAIASSNGRVIFSATGHGLDIVDPTGYSWHYTEGTTPGSTNHYQIPWSDDPLTISLTNNDVPSAIFYIDLEL